MSGAATLAASSGAGSLFTVSVSPPNVTGTRSGGGVTVSSSATATHSGGISPLYIRVGKGVGWLYHGQLALRRRHQLQWVCFCG